MRQEIKVRGCPRKRLSHSWSSTETTSVLESYLYGIDDGSLDMVSSFLVNESDQECVRNAFPTLGLCKIKGLGIPKT